MHAGWGFYACDEPTCLPPPCLLRPPQVPQLNPNEALSIQFGKQLPSSRSSMGRAPTTATERNSSDGGSLEGSVADGGGQALVVTNLDPGVPYKAVRAFFARCVVAQGAAASARWRLPGALACRLCGRCLPRRHAEQPGGSS